MDELWKEGGLDLGMSIYYVLPTGKLEGIVEVNKIKISKNKKINK
jgi:hypothetical protein